MEVVNTPQQPVPPSNGFGFLFGVIILIIFVFALMYFGIPALRNNSAPMQPAQPNQSGPNISIPDKVDINVNKDD